MWLRRAPVDLKHFLFLQVWSHILYLSSVLLIGQLPSLSKVTKRNHLVCLNNNLINKAWKLFGAALDQACWSSREALIFLTGSFSLSIVALVLKLCEKKSKTNQPQKLFGFKSQIYVTQLQTMWQVLLSMLNSPYKSLNYWRRLDSAATPTFPSSILK